MDAISKIIYSDNEVGTNFYLANSRKLEMFDEENNGFRFDRVNEEDRNSYPDHMIASNIKADKIYNDIIKSSNKWKKVPGALQWYGYHSEAKILAGILDNILNEDGSLKKGITKIELHIASLKSFCQNCYTSMEEFQNWLRGLGIEVIIKLRNRESPNTQNSLKDGAYGSQLDFFTYNFLDSR